MRIALASLAALALVLGVGTAVTAAPHAPVAAGVTAAPAVNAPAPHPATVANAPQESLTTSSSGSTVPLIVLLDVSSSMDERVGDVVKLQAAKRSLEPIVRTVAGTGNVGIWTYPSNGSCGSGEYLVDVGQESDVTEMLLKLDTQQASGSTPTAAAMQAVVDDLKARSITEANLLLVSDGESNCGGLPPCEVAAELAASGFAIAIQTVGFDISDRGRTELQCIAEATGGRYFDAEDGAQLEEVISALGVPQVQLSVASADQPRAGEPMRIAAEIHNPSAAHAIDARITIAFKDAGANTIFPAATPPTMLVGSIPPGGTINREWTIIAGSRGVEADARFVVTAWSRGSASAEVEREFTTTTEDYSAASLGPLFDSITNEGQSLVIMGDSYSSGEGTSNYLPATTDVAEECHRSSETYLVPLFDAAEIPVDILACSGAVTGDFYKTDAVTQAERRATPQLEQLAELDHVPGAVVMSAGGNDIGFEKIITKCVSPLKFAHCSADLEWVSLQYAAVAGLRTPLAQTYVDTWTALNTEKRLQERGGNFAPVIALGYPQITHDARYGGCRQFTTQEVRFANQLVLALNARIRQSVDIARNDGYEVYFVDSSQYALLPDNTVCADGEDQWMNGLMLALNSKFAHPESFHPNASGYAAITNSIVEWSTTIERVPPSDARQADLGRPLWSFVAAILDLIEGLNSIDVGVDFDTDSSTRVQQGGGVEIHASGYSLGDSVVVQMHSEPMTLTTLTADENGEISGSAVIPHYASLGAHHLVLMGLAEDGSYLEQSIDLAVVQPVPNWWLPLIMASGLWLLFAGALFVAARRLKGSASPKNRQ